MLRSMNQEGPIVLVSHPIEYTFPLSFAYLSGFLKGRGEDVRVLFRKGNAEDVVKKGSRS